MTGVAKTFPNGAGLWEFFTFPERFRGALKDADRFKFHIWCVAYHMTPPHIGKVPRSSQNGSEQGHGAFRGSATRRECFSTFAVDFILGGDAPQHMPPPLNPNNKR